MRISEVNVILIKPKDGLIGFASLVVEDALYVSGIGVHQKLDNSGYRLTYPTRKSGAQNFDIFHPINRTASRALEDAILTKLKDVMNRLKTHARHDCPDAA